MYSMDKDINKTLNYLHEESGFDFSGYRPSMITRRIGKRLFDVKCENHNQYLYYLKENPQEINNLIDVLTINVSRFFRDTMTFEYIADRILPAIIYKNKQAKDLSLRVWSTGCATGEEPYSVAILINEFIKKEGLNLSLNIFATDIDKKALGKAKKARYPFESIKGVKYRLLEKYFGSTSKSFQLAPEIKDLVAFTFYDLLAKKSHAPPESIFGGFDMVFCRNVLIYFNQEYQGLIFDKLYRSISNQGYLILGESEVPPTKYQKNLIRVNDCCHIYQKR